MIGWITEVLGPRLSTLIVQSPKEACNIQPEIVFKNCKIEQKTKKNLAQTQNPHSVDNEQKIQFHYNPKQSVSNSLLN